MAWLSMRVPPASQKTGRPVLPPVLRFILLLGSCRDRHRNAGTPTAVLRGEIWPEPGGTGPPARGRPGQASGPRRPVSRVQGGRGAGARGRGGQEGLTACEPGGRGQGAVGGANRLRA